MDFPYQGSYFSREFSGGLSFQDDSSLGILLKRFAVYETVSGVVEK